MKKSGSYLARAAFAIAGGPGLILSAQAYTPSKDLPSVYESYDNNATGPILPTSGAGTTSRGYGIRDSYNSIGGWSSGAIQVVTPGLAFGTLTNGTGKCVQIDSQANQTATGFSVKLDPGKATGDTDFYDYDKLYCSYLVRYSSVSDSAGNATTTAPRGEIRVSNIGTVGFQVHSENYVT